VNVLVVDDDDDLRETLAALLSASGHHVAVAANGEVALRWLANTSELPDVILLDWMMPRMDGLEFRKRQRQDARLAAIPVVLMTAAHGGRVPLDEIAADAVLHKPNSLIELLRVLERVGPGPGSREGEPAANG
jgi:DNA-binding response OmpR family regulator